jgi:hypothetical protein
MLALAGPRPFNHPFFLKHDSLGCNQFIAHLYERFTPGPLQCLVDSDAADPAPEKQRRGMTLPFHRFPLEQLRDRVPTRFV